MSQMEGKAQLLLSLAPHILSFFFLSFLRLSALRRAISLVSLPIIFKTCSAMPGRPSPCTISLAFILSLPLHILCQSESLSTSAASSSSSGSPRVVAPPADPSNSTKSHSSLGIALGVVFGLIAAFIICCLTWWILRKRRKGGWEHESGRNGAGHRKYANSKSSSGSKASWSPNLNVTSTSPNGSGPAAYDPQSHSSYFNGDSIWTRFKRLFVADPTFTTYPHGLPNHNNPQGAWPPPLGSMLPPGAQPPPGLDPNQPYHYPYDPNSPYQAYDPNYPPPPNVPPGSYNPYAAPQSPSYPVYQYGGYYDPNAPPNRAPNRYIPGYTLSTITEKSTPQSFNANRSLKHGPGSFVGSMRGAGGAGGYSPASFAQMSVAGAYSPMSGIVRGRGRRRRSTKRGSRRRKKMVDLGSSAERRGSARDRRLRVESRKAFIKISWLNTLGCGMYVMSDIILDCILYPPSFVSSSCSVHLHPAHFHIFSLHEKRGTL
ncbi:hypothetical protein CPC08DRAFT_321125 [Agrocybe pediades]|nr:hypothetical protein CPC08DRAFT_321125 [Agrocybe pediades]